jgi:hypothetical protein
MIVELGGFADDIVAVQAQGQVTGDDYTETLVPAVERRLENFDKVRLLYQIGPDFKRFTTTALWEDTRVGLHHLHAFERIAIVTDTGWIGKLIETIAITIPGKLRCFSLDELDTAMSWINERNAAS